MKNQKEYLPLSLLKADYGISFSQIEQLRTELQTSGTRWDDICYIPVSVVLFALYRYQKKDPLQNTVVKTAIDLASLTAWRIYKEVYSFSPELECLLYEQAEDSSISVDILDRLPYPCIYIEAPQLVHTQFHGFFVSIDIDLTKNIRILRCLALYHQKQLRNFDVPLISGKTLKEGIALGCQEEWKQWERTYGKASLSEHKKAEELEFKAAILSKMIQLILYLCADNADIIEHSEQKKITKKPEKAFIKDNYREIRKWEVGIRIIHEIKKNQKKKQEQDSLVLSAEENKEKRKSYSLRPHCRRGHWHSFWTGKRNEPNKRVLILKWLPPMWIHMEQVADLPVVVHKFTSDLNDI